MRLFERIFPIYAVGCAGLIGKSVSDEMLELNKVVEKPNLKDYTYTAVEGVVQGCVQGLILPITITGLMITKLRSLK